MKCSNCEAEHKVGDGIMLTYNDKALALLCPDCLKGVNIAKIVFKKEGEGYAYEGYIPVDCK